MTRTVCLAALAVAASPWNACGFVPSLHHQYRGQITLRDSESSVEEALQRTAAHLETLKKLHPRTKDEESSDEREVLFHQYLQRSANSLKEELKSRGLPRSGRKPELARRLADSDLRIPQEESEEELEAQSPWQEASENVVPIESFAGLQLSEAAGKALGTAAFRNPSPIQEVAIPLLAQGQSAILHAETGSGKTLAYLLPVTEQLWLESDDDQSAGFCLCLTPTRELAAQVAGIASVLAPPGSVRLVSHPTNLMRDPTKDRGELPNGGRMTQDGRSIPRLFVGSAKCIMTSLYGDKKMPAPPTSKPEAQFFLRNTRWLILDEVDRLLNVKKSRSEQRFKVHEKPAAMVTSAVTRLTLGRAQVVAASATVGRPLKRELSRVLGLPAQECPPVLRGEDIVEMRQQQQGRAVTIPPTVKNYVVAVDGTTVGKLLTSAFFVIKSLPRIKSNRILLVLTRGCGMNTQNAIGALKHFGCQPEPKSLLDALEADGTDNMIQVHREVSGAKGVGESYFSGKPPTDEDDDKGDGYLLVTGEDTVRGLHLDGLDMVIIVGRPHGPDEYTHIAGRTGRAGRHGKVINVVSEENAAALKSWERMLNVDFFRLDVDSITSLE